MKTSTSKRLFALLLAVVMCLSLVVPVSAAETSTSVSFEQVDNSEVTSSLLDARKADDARVQGYRQSDRVRVSIVLDKKSTIEEVGTVEDIAANEEAVEYRAQLQEQQDEVVEAIEAEGVSIDVAWNLTLAANIISADVQYGDIEDIVNVDGVADVIIETRYEPDVAQVEDSVDPNMATSSDMIGSGLAWAAGYTGAGSKIAVIDTGTDTDHQSFDAGAFEYAIAEVKQTKDVDLMDVTDIAAVLDQLNIAGLVDNVNDLYLNAKLPFAFNYVDEDFDVIHDNDTQGEHGSHVAGIATANRYIPDGNGGYTDALTTAHTQGVAPDAQLLTMKVFGKGGGAYDSDYMAAIEDAIVLGADSINLSLGSGNPGFSYYTGSGYTESGTSYQDLLDGLAEYGAVVCMSAGNSGTWQENTLYGYLYNDGVSMQTDGSPGSYTNSFTVASADNTGFTGNFLNYGEELPAVSFTESSGYTNVPIATLDTTGNGTEYDFIFFENTGVDGSNANLLTPYADVCKDKVVMVYRGTSSFYQKHDAVGAVGGIACVVVNNQAGTINMDLSDSTSTIPCVSITQADGEAVKALTTTTAVTNDAGEVLYYTGKVIISSEIGSAQGNSEYISMSSFSSWGTPGSLQLKPEITAPGGNIYSVNGAIAGGQAYENMSGTSMASPQVAGMMAVMAQYIRENGLTTEHVSARTLAQSLIMSTAEPLVEEASGYYYSLLNQGAGLANVNDAINAKSYIIMDDDANSGASDGKVKVELGDDPDKTGTYTFGYTLYNMRDEATFYAFNTDVFTQDVFAANTYSGVEVLLDTWTVELEDAEVTYNVDQGTSLYYEEGTFTALDAQKALDHATGDKLLAANEVSYYDVDGDGKVTSYDAYLILNMSENAASGVAVEANGSVHVTVTINVSDCDFTYYPTGAYIEAYSYIEELFETEVDEGVEGTVHSIPVLGYYGSWTSPSMYDVGTLADFWYETEERYPYLINYTDAITNYLTVKYPGDNGEYWYFGNPLTDDAEYLEERNAFNSNGSLYKYYYTLIRNAGGSIWQVTDANTGEVYARTELGSKNSAYYYSNGSAWYNTQSNTTLDWQGTDLEGDKLPEDTEVYVSLVMAPEYYRSEDGTYDWDALTDGLLDEGAYLTTRTAIDNTAPEVLDVSITLDGEMTVTAKDNRYLAVAALYKRGVSKELDFVAPNQALEDKGEAVECVFDVSGLEAGAELYIQLTDYAMNQTTYKLVLLGDNTPQDPTSITLDPSSVTVVKGTSAQISVSYEPWIANEGVVWTSADEDIATVDENGIVTGVEVGTTTVTATSVYNETVFGTCEVTVKAYDVTLTGALQDVGGDPQLFTWNLAEDNTWTKTVDIDNNINAITYGSDIELVETDDGYDIEFNDDVMYQMDTEGYLYKVDVESGETLETSAATIAFGAPVDDMEYGYISSQLFGQNVLFGVYGTYLVYSVPAEGNTFNYGWNLKSYLANYTGSSAFTTISWVGYTKNNAGNYVDVFYCLTDTGDVWLLAPDLQEGSASLNFFGTDLDLSFPGYGGTYYCSMVLGEDNNLYLSYFDGSTNQIYVLEENEDGDFNATLLGDVGGDVWPAGLLTVTSNKADADTAADTEMVVDTKWTVEAEAQKVEPRVSASKGSLNALDLVDSVAEAVSARTPLANGEIAARSLAYDGKLYVKVVTSGTTNGVAEVNYDSDVLTLNRITFGDVSINSDVCENGDITLGYANRGAYNGTVATLVFDYNTRTCPATTDITFTVKENGSNVTLNKVSVDTVPLVFNSTTSALLPDLVGGGFGSGLTGSGSSSKPSQLEYLSQYIAGADFGISFSDVKANNWYYGYVMDMANAGVINGYPDGTFRPQGEVTWGEALKLTAKALGYGDMASDGTHWASGYLLWAKTRGFVASDASINLDSAISRGDMADLLAKAMGLAQSQSANPFADEADGYAVALYEAGILTGSLDNGQLLLRANSTLTRAEMATIIWRVYNK